uniref:Uncharacterized protein n=1 Tax=Anguilla anguilla TaxID=7936 RepID=A0A0E9X525_ANGAN
MLCVQVIGNTSTHCRSMCGNRLLVLLKVGEHYERAYPTMNYITTTLSKLNRGDSTLHFHSGFTNRNTPLTKF